MIFRLIQKEKKFTEMCMCNLHWDKKANKEEISHFHPVMSDDRNLLSILFY